MPDEDISLERAKWELEAPKLVIVDGVAFVIQLVSNDEAESIDQVFDAGFLRYEIKGPVAQGGPSYLWLADAMEDFISDPVEEPPTELTSKARQAFESWLAWSHENEG
jgi:hypothetical protein